MSNWSRVIVCWSGIDDEAESKEEIDRRAGALSRDLYGVCLESTIYPPGADADDFPGHMACEVTVVYDCNHFTPDEMVAALRAMTWEKPEEVEVMWKDEEALNYSFLRLPLTDKEGRE